MLNYLILKPLASNLKNSLNRLFFKKKITGYFVKENEFKIGRETFSAFTIKSSNTVP
jgi:hypothetical protein